MNEFFGGDYALAPVNVPGVILGLLLAFVGGQTIAWVYMFTHSGLSTRQGNGLTSERLTPAGRQVSASAKQSR
jgi:hypothetical protein